jgi:hypothetical protein
MLCSVTQPVARRNHFGYTYNKYLVHSLDQGSGLNWATMSVLLQVNDVPDADQLHRALAALLECGDWRKFGGRLRLNVTVV